MSIIVDCQSCGGKLRVPEQLLGRRVRCPKCRVEFQAGARASPPAAVPSLGPSAELPPPAPPSEPHVAPTPSAAAPPPPDQPSEDERPWEQPYRRPVPRDCEPHRGALILVLGILSIVLAVMCGPTGLPFGIIAWILGQRDLKSIRANRMDPEGEGLTQGGWICGIIGTILNLLQAFVCVVIVVIYAALILGAVSALPPSPPPPPPAPPPVPGNFPGGGVPLSLADYVPRSRG